MQKFCIAIAAAALLMSSGAAMAGYGSYQDPYEGEPSDAYTPTIQENYTPYDWDQGCYCEPDASGKTPPDGVLDSDGNPL